MKKFFGLILVLILIVVAFTGCNVSMGMGSYEFNKVHVDTYHYSGCLEVDKWYENSTGLEIKTEDGQSLYFSEGTYILIEDKCPFCE